jgi:CRP/FNR family transcriptional regulator
MALPDFENQLLIIRRNDFLAHLTDEEYEMLDITHNFLQAEKNAYLYFDAKHHNKLYFIKEGFVRIGHVDDAGNEFVKDILQPGDVFGQITLERDGLQHEYAQAHKRNAVLCAFTIQDFSKLLALRPDMAIVYAQTVGERMRKIENRLLNLLQRDVRSRLLYFFWTLLSKKEGSGQEAVEIPNYLTHEDIARLTGTSRQTVTTLVNQLAEEGHLKVDRKAITIYSVPWLLKEAKVS